MFPDEKAVRETSRVSENKTYCFPLGQSFYVVSGPSLLSKWRAERVHPWTRLQNAPRIVEYSVTWRVMKCPFESGFYILHDSDHFDVSKLLPFINTARLEMTRERPENPYEGWQASNLKDLSWFNMKVLFNSFHLNSNTLISTHRFTVTRYEIWF